MMPLMISQTLLDLTAGLAVLVVAILLLRLGHWIQDRYERKDKWPPKGGIFTSLVLIGTCAGATGQERTNDGQLWHDLPPPMNLVNAGFLLERSAKSERDATWIALATTGAGAVVYAAGSEPVGLAIAGAGLSVGVVLHMRGARHQRIAGRLLQLGYGVGVKYDLVPDRIDDLPPSPIVR